MQITVGASEGNIFAVFLSFWFKDVFQAWIQASDIIAISSSTKPICDVWPQMVKSIGIFCPFAIVAFGLIQNYQAYVVFHSWCGLSG